MMDLEGRWKLIQMHVCHESPYSTLWPGRLNGSLKGLKRGFFKAPLIFVSAEAAAWL